MSNKSNPYRVAPLALAALLCCCKASAEISDTIHPFVALGYTYDDNLLRLPDEVTGVTQRSDRSRQVQAGITFDRPISRQKLTGRAKVSRVTFDHYTELDYNGKDMAADLAWQLGNRLSGNIGTEYEQTLTPFSDFHSSERNLRTRRNVYGNGAWRFHPSWQVRTAFTQNKFDYELVSQRLNNRTEDRSEVGVDFLAASGSRAGLVVRRLTGKYKNQRQVNGVVFNNDYTQDELKANVNWLASGITQVSILAGYAKREYEYMKVRDSSGVNGRLSVNWAPFGKLSFNGALWREFAAVENMFVTNSLNNGGSIGATWNISGKVQATASTRRETRKFEQVEGVVFTGDPRDRIKGSTLGLTWVPTNSIQLSATAFRDSRNGSPLAGTSDYRAKGLSISASGQF